MTECMICYNTNDTVAPCGSNTNCSATVCMKCFATALCGDGYFSCVFCKQTDVRRNLNAEFYEEVSGMASMDTYAHGAKLFNLLEKTVYMEDEEYTGVLVDDVLVELLLDVEDDVGMEELDDLVEEWRSLTGVQICKKN